MEDRAQAAAGINHLNGGCEGHSDLLGVIGEEVGGSFGLHLPGPWGRLGVEVSRLTCHRHAGDTQHRAVNGQNPSVYVYVSVCEGAPS